MQSRQERQIAVEAVYVASDGKMTWCSYNERVAYLFDRYQPFTRLLQVEAPKEHMAKP